MRRRQHGGISAGMNCLVDKGVLSLLRRKPPGDTIDINIAWPEQLEDVFKIPGNLWRRGWDLNPRRPHKRRNGFRDRRIQPDSATPPR